MISKQAVLDVLKNYELDDLDTAYLTAQINSLPSISDGWISVETPPTDEFWKRVLVAGKHHILPHTFDGENWYEYGSSSPVFNVSHYKDFEDLPPAPTK